MSHSAACRTVRTAQRSQLWRSPRTESKEARRTDCWHQSVSARAVPPLALLQMPQLRRFDGSSCGPVARYGLSLTSTTIIPKFFAPFLFFLCTPCGNIFGELFLVPLKENIGIIRFSLNASINSDYQQGNVRSYGHLHCRLVRCG